MADIRISNLTTASASASDDYIGIDGSTNGTRKLSAYSPTFGGSLTVSGVASVGGKLTVTNGNVRLSNSYYLSGNLAAGAENPILGMNASDKVSLDPNGYGVVIGATATVGGNLTVSGSTTLMSANGASMQLSGAGTGQKFFEAKNTGGDLYVGVESSVAGSFFPGSEAYGSVWYSPLNNSTFLTPAATFSGIITSKKNLDSLTTETDYGLRVSNTAGDGGLYIGANSTVSVIQSIDPGTTFDRKLAINPNGGNFLVGTTVDGGQKFQVAGTAYVSGDATFAGNVKVSKAGTTTLGNSAFLRLDDTTAGLNRTEIGFGYKASTYQPVVAGYISTSSNGNTRGNFYIATRNSDSDIAPTVRFSVAADGKINMASLPTSSAGLSAGDIWNDGGTLKIV